VRFRGILSVGTLLADNYVDEHLRVADDGVLARRRAPAPNDVIVVVVVVRTERAQRVPGVAARLGCRHDVERDRQSAGRDGFSAGPGTGRVPAWRQAECRHGRCSSSTDRSVRTSTPRRSPSAHRTTSRELLRQTIAPLYLYRCSDILVENFAIILMSHLNLTSMLTVICQNCATMYRNMKIAS